MSTFSLEQFNQFDEVVTNSLYRLSPLRFTINRLRVGNTIIYDVLDSMENGLWARYVLSRLQEGEIQHGLWLRDEDSKTHAELLAMLTDEMKRVVPQFMMLIDEKDFIGLEKVERIIFRGTVQDVVRYVQQHTSGGRKFDIHIAKRTDYDGGEMVALGLSTKQQLESWRLADNNITHLEGVGSVIIRRINAKISRVLIFAGTSPCEEFMRFLIDRMESEGVVEPVGHPTPQSLKILADQIAERFNIDEMNSLILELGADSEDIPGDTRTKKAEQIVMFTNRRGDVKKLVEQCSKKRPNYSWSYKTNSAAELK